MSKQIKKSITKKTFFDIHRDYAKHIIQCQIDEAIKNTNRKPPMNKNSKLFLIELCANGFVKNCKHFECPPWVWCNTLVQVKLNMMRDKYCKVLKEKE